MLEKIKSKKEYVIIFIVTILIMIPFISKNYLYGDDTKFHISNIYARYVKLSQFDFSFQKVLPLIARDFGYGVGIFYPGLAHFITSIIAFALKGRIISTLKLVHFSVYFISAIMMYKLVNTIFKNKFVATISAIFYITFPYSITEVFIRDALAESFIYMFMPMIILGLYHLFYGERKYFYLYFIIGYVGIINSHLVLAVYFTALITIYLLLNIKKVFRKENLKPLIISSILILLIVSPFIIPMLQHKMLNIYEVFESDSMTNYETITNSALSIKEFFIQEKSTKFKAINYYLNLLSLAMVVVTIIFNRKIIKSQEERNFFKFLGILAVTTTFLISNLFPWKFAPKMMVMVQFAWRLEAILIISLSILSALSVRNIKNNKWKIVIFIGIIIFNAFTVYRAYDFERIKEHKIKDINISNYGTGWEKEYLPVNTINNLKYFNKRNYDIIVKKGKANVEIIEYNTPNLIAKVQECNEETVIEFPRIYYLGYELILTGENEEKQKLNTYMNDKGFLEAKINQNGTLQLKYIGTMANRICNIISIITIIGTIGTYIYLIKKEKI